MTVTDHVRHQARTKVTGEVDGIACLPSETSTNAKDDEEEAERRQRTSSDVSIVLQSVDQEHEQGAGDELGEEHAGSGHESRRVCAEDTSGGIFAGNGTNACSALEDINRRLVVGIDDRSGRHCTKKLSEHVDWEFSPREFPEDAICKRHGRVEMRS